MKKRLQIAFYLVLALCVFWFVASFIDVNMHNQIGVGYGKYQEWNIFYLILKGVVK